MSAARLFSSMYNATYIRIYVCATVSICEESNNRHENCQHSVIMRDIVLIVWST